ncbi:MAG: glycoside hydrolase family 127 protein [Agriterribacter sp.]
MRINTRSLLLLFIIQFVVLYSNAQQPALKKNPYYYTPDQMKMNFGGVIGERLHANLENWELSAPDANPAMLEMFYDRDRKPDRKLNPWSGEFVGKYLCEAILSYRILHDLRQKKLIDKVVKEFLASQGADGYLGAFDQKARLTGGNWDVWNHYWAIRALLLYNDEFKSAEALNAATKAADLLVNTFLDKNFHLTNDGSQGQMNYAVIHAFTKLYMLTGKTSYLDMAKWIVKEWELPGAGNYMTNALNGKDMYQFPGRRWESVHDFLGMYDMYLVTGEQKYYDAFTHIWYSIQKGDRHNTGGFTSGEETTGNPYAQGAIETCCTVAWIDMSIDMLKLTGNSLVADELELSTYNGLLGGQHPSGRWWTYNTPMDGVKEASAHTINFQCRPGSPELNCCSVNGPRGLALLSEWAVLRSEKNVAINFYGQSKFTLQTPGGKPLTIAQQTDYPRSGRIIIDVALNTPEQFTMQLRIPAWSGTTLLKVNGKRIEEIISGSYLDISRTWKKGDLIEVTFDMSPHYWVGDKELKEKTSIYYGPLLLAFDPAYNKIDASAILSSNVNELDITPVTTRHAVKPWVLFSVKNKAGNEIILCDYATAGAYGNSYVSWLPLRGVIPIQYSKEQLIWVNRKRFEILRK